VRDYELTLIFRPDLGDEAAAGATDRVGGWITASGGEIGNIANAGRKRLAFPIKHSRDGTYVVMQVRTRPQALDEIERNLKLANDVLRYIFLRR
jgi:small subunit ribosomal protein S6